jgi:magnesium transporter
MAMQRRTAGLASLQESASFHVARNVPTFAPESTAAEVRAALAGRQFDCFDLIVILDAERRVLGVLPIARLLALEPTVRLDEAMVREFPFVDRNTDQERIASLALHHGLTAVPVMAENGRLLGIVPAEALLAVLRKEHVEDLHRLAGIARETEVAREAIEAPPTRRARHRLPWLLVGLAGSVIAAAVVAQFEQVLEKNLAVAFFVPGIVYLADAIGTQTETITVRGLSLSHARVGQLLAGEVRTGLIIGAALGSITLAGVWIAMGDAKLALAVALALIAAGALATTIGLALPWFLDRLGRDPAFGSGPLATIIQDVLSLTIYFAMVTLFVA